MLLYALAMVCSGGCLLSVPSMCSLWAPSATEETFSSPALGPPCAINTTTAPHALVCSEAWVPGVLQLGTALLHTAACPACFPSFVSHTLAPSSAGISAPLGRPSGAAAGGRLTPGFLWPNEQGPGGCVAMIWCSC